MDKRLVRGDTRVGYVISCHERKNHALQTKTVKKGIGTRTHGEPLRKIPRSQLTRTKLINVMRARFGQAKGHRTRMGTRGTRLLCNQLVDAQKKIPSKKCVRNKFVWGQRGLKNRNALSGGSLLEGRGNY